MNKTVVLDSNIIIYTGLVQHHQLRNWLKTKKFMASSISQVEVLGYPNLLLKEERFFNNLFNRCIVLPVDSEIIKKAIELRQQKKMSLGDAIIAATAIAENLPLVTANTKDFQHIGQLDLIDPLTL